MGFQKTPKIEKANPIAKAARRRSGIGTVQMTR